MRLLELIPCGKLVQETEDTILKCDISCVYLESIVIVLLQTKRKIQPIRYRNRKAYSQVFLYLKVLPAVAAQCYGTVNLQPRGCRRLHGRHLYSLPRVHREVSSHQKCSKGTRVQQGRGVKSVN